MSDNVRRSAKSVGGSETHHGHRDLRWVSQGLNPSYALLRRTVTFRGDTDEAFRRAAVFVGETLKEVMPKP